MEGYSGDLLKTQIIDELLKIPREKRDEAWKQKFFANVDEASFRCGDPQIIQGPDGFPYFALYVPEPNKEFQCFVIKHMKDDFLLEKGCGVAIEPAGNAVAWVFTYGDVVNYHLSGQFYSSEPAIDAPAEDAGRQALLGQPSESFFPAAARNVLRSWLASLGIQEPKMVLVSRPGPQGVFQELVFDLVPEMFPSQQHYESAMGRIGWFLPRHYHYAAAAKDSSLGSSFVPL